MKNKYTILTLVLLLSTVFVNLQAQIVNAFARQGEKVHLEIDWNENNYGTLQWQQSLDNGANWTNIQNATTPFYEFLITQDVFLRVKIDAQQACLPFYVERRIKALNFDFYLKQAYTDKLEFTVSSIDLDGADVVEYGLCYNQANMDTRDYRDLYKVPVSETYPGTSSFNLMCNDLNPYTQYKFRYYFRTADGSMVYGQPIVVSTLGGMKWSTEDWIIEKNSIAARFESVGTTIPTNKINLRHGTSQRNLKTVSFSHLGGNKYMSDEIRNLVPDRAYLFELITDVGGRQDTIYREIKTQSDYSSIVVDQTYPTIQNTVKWDENKTLHRISPTNLLHTEYPRVIRVGPDTLLCSYHGGNASDHWLNIYLQKSFDDGETWTEPVLMLDKENSEFGTNYYRFSHPSMVQLQNGWILMTFVGNGNPETNENCHVMVITSKDRGATWSDPVIVGRGRSWEPTIVQLPNGELELLVASEAKWWGQQSGVLDKEVLYSRSTDNGQTWTEFRSAASSPNRRDGMPSAVVMQGNRGVLFVAETANDQGYGSPSVVHRDLNGGWNINPWNGADMPSRWKVNMDAHGGGPFMIQLPTGEMLIAAHTHGGPIWQTSTPSVVVGNQAGKNFRKPVRPVDLPSNQGLYFNSLFLKDNETVWLVVTHVEYNGNTRAKGEIKFLEGKIVEVNHDDDDDDYDDDDDDLPGFDFTLGSTGWLSTISTKVARVTGASLPNENLPNPNQTHINYNLASTDLGIIWEMSPGEYGVFFGDSFGGEFIQVPEGGPGAAPTDWRANLLAYTENTDLHNGLKFSGMAMDPYRPKHAREIVPKRGYLDFTSIPTAAIEANGVQYVHYMDWQVFGQGNEHMYNSSIYRSFDKGRTWQSCKHLIEFPAGSRFGMVGYAKRKGYIYMIGTVLYRKEGGYLARCKEDDILDRSKYEYWNGVRKEWVVGDESQSTLILDGKVGELSFIYMKKAKRWLVAYFDPDAYAIVYRTAEELTGTWSPKRNLARGLNFAQLYGSYIHPLSAESETEIYYTMSQWQPYNVFLMRAPINKR